MQNYQKVISKIQGINVKDGAGVNLVRVLGKHTSDLFDPILMLDSFDSKNPQEYIAGFPMHPHRGIETISYVIKGKMEHRDSLGYSDMICDGELQWMCAGSGILHEERLQEVEHLLGVQLWLNLPKKSKMTTPSYHSIKDIQEIRFDGGYLKLLAGNYDKYEGFRGSYLPLDYYHICLESKASFELHTKNDYSAMAFMIVGQAKISDEYIEEKTAIKLSQGDLLHLANPGDKPIHILYIASRALREPIAWGGPIVMNNDRQLQQAFNELHNGNFLKEHMRY